MPLYFLQYPCSMLRCLAHSTKSFSVLMISFLINNFRLGFGHVTLKNLDFLTVTLTLVFWTELHFCVNRFICCSLLRCLSGPHSCIRYKHPKASLFLNFFSCTPWKKQNKIASDELGMAKAALKISFDKFIISKVQKKKKITITYWKSLAFTGLPIMES